MCVYLHFRCTIFNKQCVRHDAAAPLAALLAPLHWRVRAVVPAAAATVLFLVRFLAWVLEPPEDTLNTAAAAMAEAAAATDDGSRLGSGSGGSGSSNNNSSSSGVGGEAIFWIGAALVLFLATLCALAMPDSGGKLFNLWIALRSLVTCFICCLFRPLFFFLLQFVSSRLSFFLHGIINVHLLPSLYLVNHCCIVQSRRVTGMNGTALLCTTLPCTEHLRAPPCSCSTRQPERKQSSFGTNNRRCLEVEATSGELVTRTLPSTTTMATAAALAALLGCAQCTAFVLFLAHFYLQTRSHKNQNLLNRLWTHRWGFIVRRWFERERQR